MAFRSLWLGGHPQPCRLQERHTQSLPCCRILAGPRSCSAGRQCRPGMLAMSWVLSMGVVEGLSAEQIAGRLEAELGEETTSDSPSGEEAGPGPGLPAVGIHGDGRAVIVDDRDADATVLEGAAPLSRVNCGLFRVGCWVDGAMAWQIIHCREEPATEEYQILGVPPGSLPTRRRRTA